MLNMTAQEKQDIYNLLKAAESNAFGYVPESFNAPAPVFEDDVITENLQVKQTQSEKITGSSVNDLAGNKMPELSNSNSSAEKTQSSLENINRAPENIKETPENPSEKSSNAQEKLQKVYEKIYSCHNCILSENRKNAVPGEGISEPYVMVIGEGPGEDEDIQGKPFVGKAGQLLDKMLYAIQLDRNANCYIGNIVKCRPPMNRTPMPDEGEACRGFLEAQIHILKPKMILAMGRCAVQNLLKTTQGINSLRGKILEYHLGGNENSPAIPLLATYHPSALLRDAALKRPAWEDLKTFKSKLLELCPDYQKAFFEIHPEAKN